MKKDSKQTQLTPVAHAVQSLCKTPAIGAADKYLKATVRGKGQWLANAVMFGTIAANAKQRAKNKGEFTEWLKAVCHSANVSLRTGYNYIYLAAGVLHKIQTSRADEPLGGSLAQYVELSSKPVEEILGDEKQTFDMLGYVLSSLPEPTLNDMLRQSNAQAIDAERELEDSSSKTLTKRDLKGLSGNVGGQQLDFFSELYNDFRATIEAPRSDRRFSEMPRAEMEQLGNYLIAQGREIVEIAKGKKD